MWHWAIKRVNIMPHPRAVCEDYDTTCYSPLGVHYSNVYVKLITYKGETFCKLGKTRFKNVADRDLVLLPGATMTVWRVIKCPTRTSTKVIEEGLLKLARRPGWHVDPDVGPLGYNPGYTELFKHNVFTHPATAQRAEEFTAKMQEKYSEAGHAKRVCAVIREEIDVGTLDIMPRADLAELRAKWRSAYFEGAETAEPQYRVIDADASGRDQVLLTAFNTAEYFRLSIIKECMAEEAARDNDWLDTA